MRCVVLIGALVGLPLFSLQAQNNPFSPLRIWVQDSGMYAIGFKSVGDITGDSITDYVYQLWSEFGNPPPQEQFFRGGLPLDTVPLYGLAPGCDFAKAGDLNGDGLTDFLMTQGGQLYAFWGIPGGIDTVPRRLLTIPGGGCGPVVSNVDVNGDGYKDVLLLARQDSGNAVYLFKGKPGGIDSLQSWKVSTPPRSPSALRELISMDAGDLNRDGYDDVLIGKEAAFQFQDSIFGLVEIYFGGPDSALDTIPDFAINPPTLNASHVDSIYFGSQVKFLGDLNADGWPELADGPRRIYSGPPVLNWQPAYRIEGGDMAVGDVNGDGYRDLMVGFTTFPPPAGFGGVLFYLGGPRFDTIPDAVISDQDLPNDFLENIGSAVGFIGDINGDGAEEFMFLSDRIIPANRHEVFMFAGNTAVKTGVNDNPNPQIPRSFELFQNSPNPFSISTEIGFRLKSPLRTESLRLEVFNLLGQKVRMLVDERGKAGEKKAIWDGKDERGNLLPSGIYFYKLSFGEETQVKRMLLVR